MRKKKNIRLGVIPRSRNRIEGRSGLSVEDAHREAKWSRLSQKASHCRQKASGCHPVWDTTLVLKKRTGMSRVR